MNGHLVLHDKEANAMFDQSQACQYLEVRVSEATADVERLEAALHEAKRRLDAARTLLHYEQVCDSGTGRVPSPGSPLLNQSIPSSLVEMAMLNGGEISVADAVTRFVAAGVCFTEAQARDNVHSALSRMSRKGTFVRIGRSRYKLAQPLGLMEQAVRPLEVVI